MKVLVAGDFVPYGRVADSIEGADFSCFEAVEPFIHSVDYAIVNYESPVCYGNERPIKKCGPSLHCSEMGVEAIMWAGFKCVTLANNHFLDYGVEGVRNTLNVCKENGVDTVGGGMNLKEASQILYKQIVGKTLAIINCCEHEFSIATEITPGSNPLNPIQQYYAIKEARKNADFILVIVHGGHELWQLPSPRMQETYRFFIDAGADAVVNHHQHCFSGYEYYNGKPVVYGLGNFCFERQGRPEQLWNYGYMLILDLSNEIGIDIVPYEQCREHPKVIPLSDREDFNRRLDYLNKIISSSENLKNETDLFYENGSKGVFMPFEPYKSAFLRKLYLKGFIPSFVRNKKKILNTMMCESHRDKAIYAFTKQIGRHDK